jgi:hypothetical protein
VAEESLLIQNKSTIEIHHPPLQSVAHPAGQPPGEFLAMIGKYPGVPALLALGVVLVVVVLLCINSESRDYLLGLGKALSVVSLGLLLLVLTMNVVGWSVTY